MAFLRPGDLGIRPVGDDVGPIAHDHVEMIAQHGEPQHDECKAIGTSADGPLTDAEPACTVQVNVFDNVVLLLSDRAASSAARGAPSRFKLKASEIYDVLLGEIRSGGMQAGSACPSESELCRRFGVSRGTVRAALRRLGLEGYVETAAGRKRTVRERKPVPLDKLRLLADGATPSFGEYLQRLGKRNGWAPRDQTCKFPVRTPWWAVGEASRLDPGEVKQGLRLRSSAEVVWFLRLRLIGEHPLVLQWVVVPAAIVPHVGAEDLRPGGLTRLYQEVHGIRRCSAAAHYLPVAASREEARWLNLEAGCPLIRERRISFYKPGRPRSAPALRAEAPYEYLVSLYTDRVSLDFSWRDRTSN